MKTVRLTVSEDGTKEIVLNKDSQYLVSYISREELLVYVFNANLCDVTNDGSVRTYSRRSHFEISLETEDTIDQYSVNNYEMFYAESFKDLEYLKDSGICKVGSFVFQAYGVKVNEGRDSNKIYYFNYETNQYYTIRSNKEDKDILPRHSVTVCGYIRNSEYFLYVFGGQVQPGTVYGDKTFGSLDIIDIVEVYQTKNIESSVWGYTKIDKLRMTINKSFSYIPFVKSFAHYNEESKKIIIMGGSLSADSMQDWTFPIFEYDVDKKMFSSFKVIVTSVKDNPNRKEIKNASGKKSGAPVAIADINKNMCFDNKKGIYNLIVPSREENIVCLYKYNCIDHTGDYTEVQIEKADKEKKTTTLLLTKELTPQSRFKKKFVPFDIRTSEKLNYRLKDVKEFKALIKFVEWRLSREDVLERKEIKEYLKKELEKSNKDIQECEKEPESDEKSMKLKNLNAKNEFKKITETIVKQLLEQSDFAEILLNNDSRLEVMKTFLERELEDKATADSRETLFAKFLETLSFGLISKQIHLSVKPSFLSISSDNASMSTNANSISTNASSSYSASFSSAISSINKIQHEELGNQLTLIVDVMDDSKAAILDLMKRNPEGSKDLENINNNLQSSIQGITKFIDNLKESPEYKEAKDRSRTTDLSGPLSSLGSASTNASSTVDVIGTIINIVSDIRNVLQELNRLFRRIIEEIETNKKCAIGEILHFREFLLEDKEKQLDQTIDYIRKSIKTSTESIGKHVKSGGYLNIKENETHQEEPEENENDQTVKNMDITEQEKTVVKGKGSSNNLDNDKTIKEVVPLKKTENIEDEPTVVRGRRDDSELEMTQNQNTSKIEDEPSLSRTVNESIQNENAGNRVVESSQNESFQEQVSDIAAVEKTQIKGRDNNLDNDKTIKEVVPFKKTGDLEDEPTVRIGRKDDSEVEETKNSNLNRILNDSLINREESHQESVTRPVDQVAEFKMSRESRISYRVILNQARSELILAIPDGENYREKTLRFCVTSANSSKLEDISFENSPNSIFVYQNAVVCYIDEQMKVRYPNIYNEYKNSILYASIQSIEETKEQEQDLVFNKLILLEDDTNIFNRCLIGNENSLFLFGGKSMRFKGKAKANLHNEVSLYDLKKLKDVNQSVVDFKDPETTPMEKVSGECSAVFTNKFIILCKRSGASDLEIFKHDGIYEEDSELPETMKGYSTSLVYVNFRKKEEILLISCAYGKEIVFHLYDIKKKNFEEKKVTLVPRENKAVEKFSLVYSGFEYFESNTGLTPLENILIYSIRGDQTLIIQCDIKTEEVDQD